MVTAKKTIEISIIYSMTNSLFHHGNFNILFLDSTWSNPLEDSITTNCLKHSTVTMDTFVIFNHCVFCQMADFFLSNVSLFHWNALFFLKIYGKKWKIEKYVIIEIDPGLSCIVALPKVLGKVQKTKSRVRFAHSCYCHFHFPSTFW